MKKRLQLQTSLIFRRPTFSLVGYFSLAEIAGVSRISGVTFKKQHTDFLKIWTASAYMMFGAVCARMYLCSRAVPTSSMVVNSNISINNLHRQAVHTVAPGRPEAAEDQLSMFLTLCHVEGLDSFSPVITCICGLVHNMQTWGFSF